MTLKRAFTLIELLIVVAIIAILAAIAVPNFLEAQVRAKVSRTVADMRSLATAVESYIIDHNKAAVRQDFWDNPMAIKRVAPPLNEKVYDPDNSQARVGMKVFTTPIAYITSLPVDVFNTRVRGLIGTAPGISDVIDYWDPTQVDAYLTQINAFDSTGRGMGYGLVSVGPDGTVGVGFDGTPGGYPTETEPTYLTIRFVYDPSNGTISSGNIYRGPGAWTQKFIFWRF